MREKRSRVPLTAPLEASLQTTRVRDMPKHYSHTDSDKLRRGQPTADAPPGGPENPDPDTNSGYPAGGKELPEGKDAYGRDRKTQEQAGKTRPEDSQPGRGSTASR